MSQRYLLIDAGHGKETPGKRSPIWPATTTSPSYQLFEWDFNRKVARLMQRFAYEVDIEPVIIVPEDTDVPLHIRYQRVNRYIALQPIFMSIHGNAGGGTGFESFTSRGLTESDVLNRFVYESATKFFSPRFPIRIGSADVNYPGKEADFAMVKRVSHLIPSVLTESFFMDTRKDCDFMNSQEGQEQIAKMHIDAALNYFKYRESPGYPGFQK